MTLIDQRILIPAPMPAVWAIVADHQTLSRWRNDCQSVSLLSTHAAGVGVRRRVTPRKGKDFIEEFKAWYNGFGYEYSIIDSKSYKYNLSRLRLQATPDGTIVQWTIEFEVKGFLANLFGNRRRRNRLDNHVVNSLRDLRRYVMSTGVVVDEAYRTKVGVQDAPDADKRAAYGAEIFAKVEPIKTPEEETKRKTSEHKVVTIDEPPVRLDDTPSIPKAPPPSFVTQNFDVAMEPILESAFAVTDKAEKPKDKLHDTRPNEPIDIDTLTKTKPDVSEIKPTDKATPPKTPTPMAEKTSEPSKVTPPPSTAEASELPKAEIPAVVEKPVAELPPIMTDTVKPSAPVDTKPADADDEPAIQTLVSVETLPPTPATPAPVEEVTTASASTMPVSNVAETKPKRPTGLSEAISASKDKAKSESSVADMKPPIAQMQPPATSRRDTDTMSIWDVFGVERPSEMAQMVPPPAKDGEKPAADAEKPAISEATPSSEPTAQEEEKKALSLDEWLAMEEPPLPSSASTSVRTIVRMSKKPLQKVGLRKRQHQKLVHVRRPKR